MKTSQKIQTTQKKKTLNQDKKENHEKITAHNNHVILDQHFMIDEALISQLVELAQLEPNDIVLEIGCGSGNLTKHLVKSPALIIACEIDEELATKTEKSIDIHVVRVNGLEAAETMNYTKIVSNLPYGLSEPLAKILVKKKPSRVILTVGKAFADLLLAQTIMGIFIRSVYDVTVEKIIKPESFDPAPRVNSALIVLQKKQQTVADTFWNELACQLDKKVFNACVESLTRATKLTKRQAKTALIALNIDATVANRIVDQMTSEQFSELYKKITDSNILK